MSDSSFAFASGYNGRERPSYSTKPAAGDHPSRGLVMGHFHQMADGKRISETKVQGPGGSLTVGFWGYLGPNGTELDVKTNNNQVTATKGGVVGVSRQWTLKGKVGETAKVSAFYKDEYGTHCWDWFDIACVAAATPTNRKRITAAQITNKAGELGWVSWPGACPCARNLMRSLELASGGGLSSTIPAGNPSLQGAGRAKTIDEHNSGLSLDIMLNSAPPGGRARQRAHNIIRFLVANRYWINFKHMWYEGWGFGPNAPIGSSPNHGDHIHIDWFDPGLTEPPGIGNRGRWTAILWPDAAWSGSFLATAECVDGLRAAWNDTTTPLLTSAGDAYR